MTVRTLLAVAAGGVVGTSLRLGLDTVLPHGGDRFPVSTLMVNVVGALVLGFLVARVWPSAPEWLRGGLGGGVLGSFTTFSALAVSMVELSLPTAALYLGLSVVLGLGATVVGLTIGRRRPTTIDMVDE